MDLDRKIKRGTGPIKRIGFVTEFLTTLLFYTMLSRRCSLLGLIFFYTLEMLEPDNRPFFLPPKTQKKEHHLSTSTRVLTEWIEPRSLAQQANALSFTPLPLKAKLYYSKNEVVDFWRGQILPHFNVLTFSNLFCWKDDSSNHPLDRRHCPKWSKFTHKFLKAKHKNFYKRH